MGARGGRGRLSREKEEEEEERGGRRRRPVL